MLMHSSDGGIATVLLLHGRRGFGSTWSGCTEHQRHQPTNIIDAAALEDLFARYVDREGPALPLLQTYGLSKLSIIA